MRYFGLFSFLGAFVFIILLILIALYLLFALGLYKMAKNRSIEYDWLAFIPIAQLYILGKLIKNLKVFNYDIPSIELVLPISLVVVLVLGQIPVLGFLLWLAMAILFYAAIYKLYTMYKGPEEAKTMLVKSIVSIILFGFMVPVYVFTLRDSKPLES